MDDKDYMKIALAEARAAADRGEVPIGAVIVDPAQGKIIARDGNRPIELKDPTAHAEILAIREACRLVDNYRLTGFDLYVTLEPCTMCVGAITFARMRRLIFAAEDVKGGAVQSGARFFEQSTCHHRPDVVQGVFAEEASSLLKNFFAVRR